MLNVLIIGAGIGQENLARKVKERGHRLIVSAFHKNYPLVSMADQVLIVDNILDKDGVVKLARESKIDVVITDQSDVFMPTVAFVAEHLGLPGNTSDQVHSYCNKNAFRDICESIGVPVPKHISTKSSELTDSIKALSLPWIVKPADSQSSVGVTKVSSVKDYSKAICDALNNSPTGNAIVEEFFEGKEVVVEGFIFNGKYYNIAIADRRYFRLDNLFIPSQTIFPSVVADSKIAKKIISYETKFAKHVQPSFGIVHSEYLVNDETKEIRVVESAIRGGGVYISSHLIPLCTGIDVNDMLLDCAEGKAVDVDNVISEKQNRSSAYICFYLPQGRIESVSGIEEINKMPFVALNKVNLEISYSSQLTHKGQRLGPIIVHGDNRQEVENHIMEIQDTLHVNVRYVKMVVLTI